ncbi:MAG: hypothetical protein KDF65_15485 [Anaerolineae bacterium]|nr:hypothetical protein [Anaerolineae bacterium]
MNCFAVVLLLFALLSLGVLFMVNVFHLFGQCLELTGQPTAGAKDVKRIHHPL